MLRSCFVHGPPDLTLELEIKGHQLFGHAIVPS